MKKETRKLMLKHILAVVFLAIVTLIYLKPLLDGMDIRQSDMVHFEGMSKELKDYHQAHGDYSYWTNAMFSGMPAAFIYGKPDANVYWWMGLPIQKGTPMMSYGIIFTMLLCFYIVMCVMGMNIWIALGAALAYAFCSYNLIIIEAGHVTKAYVIAAIPLVVSGVILAYQNKRLAGFLVFMIGFGFSLAQNHPQITYYTGLAVAAYVLVAFIYAIINKTMSNFWKSSAILVVAGILAVLPNIGSLYTSYDYSKESMRGKSELTTKAETKGLDYDYAYAWSYGPSETFTLLVPNARGGASNFDKWETYQEKLPNTINTLQTQRFEQDPNQLLQKCSPYWGDQPFTSGPVYAGAVVCLLFLLSLFLVKGEMRVWAIVVFVASVIFAWGKHFPAINDFMFYHFPMFNKFRTPSMILVLTTFVMAFVGFYGLKQLLDDAKKDKKQLNKYLYISFGVVGGLCLLIAIAPKMFFNFTTVKDAGIPDSLLYALESDRQAMCVADAWRSFAFVAMAAMVLWLLINEKLKASYCVVALGLISLIDLWGIDKRYLNDDDFEQQGNTVAQQYAMTQADAAILQDKELGYRVLNLAANPFTDAHASYYHHSIGGYHGAKLRRYQEFVDSVMMYDINHFVTNINTVKSDSEMTDLLSSLTSLNMLNAKYFIFNYQNIPFVNQAAYGPAWFVENVQIADNADEEMSMTKSVQPLQTAVVAKDFADKVDKNLQHNALSTISLVEQTSKMCRYKVDAKSDELAVFSEIYYPKYWKVSIDGKQVDKMIRADYILRALPIEKGQHEIVFEFNPQAWFTARTISLISSILILILLVLIPIYQYYYLPKKEKALSQAQK